MHFLSFAINMSKSVGSKYSQKLRDHAKQSTTYALKTTSKKAIQKKQKQPVVLLEMKLPMKLNKSQKPHHKIIQLRMKNKDLQKDIYLQK